MMVERIYDIDIDLLYEKGFRYILIDQDNTLARWKFSEIDEKSLKWVNAAKERGFTLCIISNGIGDRIKKFSEMLGTYYINKAKKPYAFGYQRCVELLKAEKSQIIAIGDQIFTDVKGANKFGIPCILTEPIHKKEHVYTRLVRMFDRKKRNKLRKDINL